MFAFIMLCGWGLTAALIALVWANSRPGRSLFSGFGIGVVAGVLWPITFWVAIGSWLLGRGKQDGAGSVPEAALAGKIREAQAFAAQAEIEGMRSSAEYWRAEVQRLAVAQPEAPAARPIGRVVIGCTVASLVTIGLVGFGAPAPQAPAAAATSPVPVPEVVPPAAERPVSETTKLGNIAKQYGEPAQVLHADDSVAVEFTVGAPEATKCNTFAQKPANGKYVKLPVSLKTFDDPDGQLALFQLAFRWEYVGPDGRSVEVSTSNAAMCGFDAPASIGPNRTYDFDVILDVPETPGVLVHNASALGNAQGWEWPYSGS